MASPKSPYYKDPSAKIDRIIRLGRRLKAAGSKMEITPLARACGSGVTTALAREVLEAHNLQSVIEIYGMPKNAR